MYLKRKIDLFLTNWKESADHKPLIVKGPRQIGKTESIRHFARTNYDSVIEINFVEEPKYKMITSDGYSTDAIIKNISLLDPFVHFIPGRTLIFFDELQDFPDIATSLKFFCIDGRFDVICSGSMLGINYQKIESNSVGYKVDYEMFSLDFEEFLWAKGYDNAFVEDLLHHMNTLIPFSELQLSVCHTLFLDYCILGGMPAVVREFITRNTFEGSLDIQRQLIADYKEDIRKYASGMDQTRILNVMKAPRGKPSSVCSASEPLVLRPLRHLPHIPASLACERGIPIFFLSSLYIISVKLICPSISVPLYIFLYSFP